MGSTDQTECAVHVVVTGGWAVDGVVDGHQMAHSIGGQIVCRQTE